MANARIKGGLLDFIQFSTWGEVAVIHSGSSDKTYSSLCYSHAHILLIVPEESSSQEEAGNNGGCFFTV